MNMKRKIALFCVLTGLCWAAAASVHACTTFVLEGDGRILFGRNLDWDWANGLVIVNARDVMKRSFVLPGEQPAFWTSKYGSVTFNQFGQDMPYGGMNEKGLVIENMWLDETQYAKPDGRPTINLLQWIQYQLDNCQTVDEVLATDAKLRVDAPNGAATIHYLVCDAKGDCATIEFLNGKMVSHQGSELPDRALANSTYEESLAYAKAHPEAASSLNRPLTQPASLPRFEHAADRVAAFKPKSPQADLNYAFTTLDQVCQPHYTVWQIVYDVAARQIHFRTRDQRTERTLEFKNLAFDTCGQPAKFVDIQTVPANGNWQWDDLTEDRQRKYLHEFCSQPTLQARFGDLTPLMEGEMMVLKTYKCARK